MDIKLYQNCIFENDFHSLAAGFDALDFTHNPRKWLREFQIFHELFEKGAHLKHDLLGAVSINFQKKSKLDGLQVRAWIEDNPGYDVYVVNPFPQFAYCHLNLWQFTDNRCDFPFTEYSIKALQECQVEGLVHPQRRHNNDLLATCSYWFGNQKFWERYLKEVVLKVIETEPSRLSPETYKFLYEPTYYYATQGIPVGNVAFLLERTLSEFVDREQDIKSLFYPVDKERVLKCCLFEFEREIVTQNYQYVNGLEKRGHEAELKAYFEKLSPVAAQQWTQAFETMGRDRVYQQNY